MKFICNKSEFSKAINIAARIINTRLSKNILECLHIIAADDMLTIEASDTVSAIRTNVYASVSENGECLLPARVLQDIVGKLPDGELCIERKDGIKITCLSTQAELSEMDVSLYPEFPSEEGEAVSLSHSALRKMIDGTSFAVYQKEDKPVLTGILIEMSDGVLKMVAMDGFRLALRKVDWDSSFNKSIIVPSRIMKDIARLLTDDASVVKLTVSDKACFFDIGDVVFFTRLLEGNYVNYSTYFPKDCATRVRIDTRLFERSLEMLSVIAREDTLNRIRLNISDDKIDLYSRSEYGVLEDNIPVYIEGGALEVYFDVLKLLDIIRAIDDESIIMEFNGNRAPCVIKPVSENDFVYLIMASNPV